MWNALGISLLFPKKMLLVTRACAVFLPSFPSVLKQQSGTAMRWSPVLKHV